MESRECGLVPAGLCRERPARDRLRIPSDWEFHRAGFSRRYYRHRKAGWRRLAWSGVPAGFFIEARHAFAPRKFGFDIGERDPLGIKQNEQVKNYIGSFGG